MRFLSICFLRLRLNLLLCVQPMVLLGAVMLCASTPADVLYTNISGYRYVSGSPPDGTPVNLRTLPPREGYWSAFQAMLIDGDGRIAAIYSADDTSNAPATCPALEQLANQNAQKVVSELEAQNRLFDLKTDHGRATGATFP